MEEAVAPERHRGASFSRIFWIPFLVVFLYVLSIGPVIKLSSKGTLPPGLEIVYRPLITLGNQSTPVGVLLFWYVHIVWRCPFFD